MLRRLELCTTATLFVSLTLVGLVHGQGDDPPSGKIRIDTYDSLAIAAAYAPFNLNPVAQRMKAYEQAGKDGDKAKLVAPSCQSGGRQVKLRCRVAL